METAHTVNVVTAPSEEATEGVESVTIKKSYQEDQMICNLSIASQALPIRNKISVQLTIIPLVKIKIQNGQ
jgi:hypothetical protein